MSKVLEKAIETMGLKTTLVFLPILMLTTLSMAQDKWKVQTSKDGKITVKYHIKKEGKKRVVTYVSETTANVSLKKAEEFLRNVDNYQHLLDHTSKSERIKGIADHEWLAYLYFDAPWPLADSDCVQHFKLSKEGTHQLTITGKAVPDAFEMKEVGRMRLYDMKYEFKKIADQQTQIRMSATFSPAGNPAKWMLKAWFPKGPIGILNRLIESTN